MEIENDPNVIYGGDPDDEAIPYSSLSDLIVQGLRLGETKPSFIDGMTNKIWTFRDILEQSSLMSKVLLGSGIGQNDVIAIVSENRHEFPAIAFGAFFLNAVVAPVNLTYSKRELKHAFDLSKPSLVFVSAYAAKKTIATCRDLHYVKKVILIDGETVDDFVISMRDLTGKHANLGFDIDERIHSKVDLKDQVALVMCSSGTTGIPKGVMITQQNMISVIQSYRALFTLMKMIHDQTLVIMNIAPWFHALGFMSMFMVSCQSDPIFVFLPKFDEETFLRSIEKFKITTITVVPPIMVFLAKSPLVDKYDLSSIKDIGCGAATLSKDLTDQVMERFNGNVTIRQGYGLSEVTFGTLNTAVIMKPGSVGEVVKSVYAKVIDANGKSVGPNQTGELCFKGDRIMKGYIDDPQATSEVIDKNGWLHSGDLGYYDEDKQFFIVDRLKELIKYKAYQVPPAEIESLLLSHPKVKDCGVIGIPDEVSGELPFAFVVKQPGVDLSEQEVQTFVAENSSKAKWLHGGVKFVDEIPKNPSGKILRRELRDLFKNMKSKL